MSEPRLPTGLVVSACLARLAAEGRAGYVLRKGPPEGGALLVKISRLAPAPEAGSGPAGPAPMGGGFARVLSQVRDIDGRLAWMPAFAGRAVAEDEADAYVARAVARDPDLWVVEVEDPAGRNPFDGPVLDG